MNKIDLTKGKVAKVLIMLALPIMGSSLLQFTYNLIDMLFVGHLGSWAATSVGSSSFYIGLGHSLAALIMIGTSIKVSHSVGKNNSEEMQDYINSGMQLSLTVGVIYALILIVFGKNFIAFLNLNDSTIAQEAYKYLAWSAPMLIFAFFNTLFSRIFASLGNTKKALKINAIGIALNIVLDYILIYPMKLGVSGAAIATLIANIVMFICYIKAGNGIFKLSFKKVETSKMLEITKLGAPIAFQRVLFTMINIFLARLISSFGDEAIGAQKIALQIESVTYMVTGGLNGAVASFTGQNFGAKKHDRLHKGYIIALGIGVVYAAISTAIFWIFPENLARLFVDDSTTIAIIISYLQIIGFSQIFNAMEMVSNGYLTGVGKPKIPAYVSMIFTVLRLPMAYALTAVIGLTGIWWSISISTGLKGSVLLGIYFYRNMKYGKRGIA